VCDGLRLCAVALRAAVVRGAALHWGLGGWGGRVEDRKGN
jgi:hypothetical protein